MNRDSMQKALIKLTNRTAATWASVGNEAFLGAITIETSNAIYQFLDGVFAARAARSFGGQSPEWESPPNMKGAKLIGFLADEGGLWSLSPRWRAGALAVISSTAENFTLTSETSSCAIERPEPSLRATSPQTSDVFDVPGSRPPTVRRPAPPSMTRLQPAPQRPATAWAEPTGWG